jgi:hypothetical protein
LSWLGSSGVFAGSDPFGGATGFGFDIPQGDPGQAAAAAADLRRLAAVLEGQGRTLAVAARAALGGGEWGGAAADAYASYSGHLLRICSANAATSEDAAAALSSFAAQLQHAEAATRQALADCERYQSELTEQQAKADSAAEDARIASQLASSLPHPARADFDRQASEAQQRQVAAATASTAAEAGLDAAKARGSQAFDAYQDDARAVASRLQSMAADMRVAPALPGHGIVPIKVTRADVALAAAMTMSRSGRDGFPDPAELDRLACGSVNPGTALLFAADFRGRQRLAQLAAEDSLDGTVTGVMPGPVGRVAGGAWDVTKGDAKLIWSGATDIYHGHAGRVKASVAGYLAWTLRHPVAAGEQAIDWQDWSHGHFSRAAGEVGAELLVAKGTAELGGGAVRGGARTFRDVPGTRPGLLTAGGHAASALGVPHGGDLADAVGPYTKFSSPALTAGLRELPHHALMSVAPLLSTYRIEPVVMQALKELYGSPVGAVVHEPAARITSHQIPAVVRTVPRGR